jgi:hypothetical protein
MLGVQRIAGIIGFSAGLTILPLVAIAAGYDGTYAGQVTLVRGDQSICGKSPLPVTKQVVNGHFDLVYDPAHHVGVNLEVQQDGSFSGDQAYMVAANGNRFAPQAGSPGTSFRRISRVSPAHATIT